MRGWKLAALCGLMLGGLTVGGCSDDDDKKGGGGGTIVFPSIPTNIPALPAGPIGINVSGGNGATNESGGDAGDITVATGSGTIRRDDGRSLPGISTNFLTAGVMADNVVTYAELAAIDPTAFTENGGTASLDLVGADFHLPSGVTLSLGDAPLAGIFTVAIRAFGSGDVIRLDGPVVTTPPSLTGSVSLALESLSNTGTAIAISGTVDVSASTGGANDGGEILISADHGSVLLRGLLLSVGAGGGASDEGGDGGSVSIFVDRGAILIDADRLVANGGVGNGTGDGGNGGDINFNTGFYTRQRIDWGFEADGGASTGSGTGGTGGDVFLDYNSDIELFVGATASGGNSGTGTGGQAGRFFASGDWVRGAVRATANGGDGAVGGTADLGLFSINVAVDGESITGVAVIATANGGIGANGTSGDGGQASIYHDGAWCVNVRLTVEAQGGSSATGLDGGDGGLGQIQGYGVTRNAFLNATLHGGSALLTGGDGGTANVTCFSNFGEELQALVDLAANGGNGELVGGAGGNVSLQLSQTEAEVEVNILANGGDIIGSPTSPSPPGGGGTVQVGNGSAFSIDLTLAGSIRGGTGFSAPGGNGGLLTMNMADQGGYAMINTVGTFDMRGGTSTTGNGGLGGRAFLECGELGWFESDTLNLDLRGGDSPTANGGHGSGDVAVTQDGLLGEFLGHAWIRGGTINVSGGNGSTVSGTGEGGAPGDASLYSERHDINVGATILANGGNGVGNGGGSSGGEVIEISTDEDGDGIAGTTRVTGTLRSRGGDSTGGNGGDGGYIWLNNANTGTPISGGDIYVSGTIECIGGNTTATSAEGGGATGIEISSDGNVLNISGTVRTQGGTGEQGGSGGAIQVAAHDNTVITISGTLEAIGGAGSDDGGAGGDIEIGSSGFSQPALSITFTNSAVVRSQGGAGVNTDGAAGLISIDAVGTAGANVSVAAGAVIEALDGAGVSVPGNVTID